MTTLRKGDIVVLLGDRETLETGLKLIAEVESIQQRLRANKNLCAAKHGHRFDYNRVCECGLSELDYYMELRLTSDVCPVLLEIAE